MTFQTIDQSDEETWHDPKKDNDKGKYKDNDKDKLVTFDIWDTDYDFDNWEPEFMRIFVTRQLRVTLDSIRKSCDVLNKKVEKNLTSKPCLYQCDALLPRAQPCEKIFCNEDDFEAHCKSGHPISRCNFCQFLHLDLLEKALDKLCSF